MAEQNATTLGSYFAKALVSPTGGAADETLADIAQAAISVASTDACGRVELATAEETAAGADETRAVTPAALGAQHYIKSADVTCKALNDNGDVGADASQVARGNHRHPDASSAAAGFISAADKTKLAGIEPDATADQTGAEIVATIDTELGGTHWQQGGERSGIPHTHSAADLPDRGAFYGKAMGASLADKDGTLDINIPGLPAKAAARATDLVPIWDAEAAVHRHVRVAGLPAGRGIVTCEGDDPAINLELPSAVDRRDFLLGFTATGAVTTTKVATAKDVDDIAARGMTTVDTIAELCAARPRRTGGLVHARGHSKAGDGGGGTFMWEAASTKTPDGGTVFAAERDGVGRWIKLYDQFINIKSFGATGDGKADDTKAVQRAVDANVPLFVPSGIYRLTSAITWKEDRALILIGQSPYGYNAARLVDARAGNPEEPLFHKFGRYMKADGTYQFESGYEIIGSNLGGIGPRVVLTDLWFTVSKGSYGHAVEITLCKDAFIKNCTFEAAYRGLTLGQSNFDTTVINCRFLGKFNRYYSWNETVGGEAVRQIAQRAWGLYSSGHKFLKGINVAGFGAGICLNGTGTSLTGARIEVNNYGLVIGGTTYNMGGTETSGNFSRSIVSGISLEANAIAVSVKNLSSSSISGIGAQGSPSDGTRPDSEVGLLVENMGTDARIENCSFNGYFTRAAIINFSKQPLWYDGGGATGGGVDRGGINSPFGISGNNQPSYHFLKTKTSSGTITAFHDLMLPGLTGLNIRDTDPSGKVVRAKNFGDVVVPAEGATSAAVVFPTAVSSGTIAFNIINPVNDVNSVLPAGQYLYATTVVARHGECGVNYSNPNAHNYRTVDVAASQSVEMTFHGGSTSLLKRRIYRGRKVGWFEGYWDINMGASFYDNGKVPFIGKAMPPTNCSIPALTENDANYQVVATPSWPTTVHVTNKQTTGFTLNFGVAAPDSNQTVSWLMFRP